MRWGRRGPAGLGPTGGYLVVLTASTGRRALPPLRDPPGTFPEAVRSRSRARVLRINFQPRALYQASTAVMLAWFAAGGVVPVDLKWYARPSLW